MRQRQVTIERQNDGAHAVFGAVVAVVGVLAAANPQNALLRAIDDAVPRIAAAVPTLITACGAIIAAFSQPPRLRRLGEEGVVRQGRWRRRSCPSSPVEFRRASSARRKSSIRSRVVSWDGKLAK